MLGTIARSGCDVSGASPSRIASAPEIPRGWRIRHWLPLQDPVAQSVLTLLLARGAVAGIESELWLAGEADEVAEKLRRQGWRVVTASAAPARGTPSGPYAEFYTPRHELAWRGGYRVDLPPGASGELLDLTVLRQVAKGLAATPFIGVACSTASASTARGRAGSSFAQR